MTIIITIIITIVITIMLAYTQEESSLGTSTNCRCRDVHTNGNAKRLGRHLTRRYTLISEGPSMSMHGFRHAYAASLASRHASACSGRPPCLHRIYVFVSTSLNFGGPRLDVDRIPKLLNWQRVQVPAGACTALLAQRVVGCWTRCILPPSL